MTLARILAGTSSVLATLTLSGCSLVWNCTDTTAEREEAGVRVEVVNTDGRPSGVTAEVLGWRREPHPQVPADGDQVHFDFRFQGVGGWNAPAVDACAVDEKRVVLGCQTVHGDEAFGRKAERTGDSWLHVEHPERTAEVLVIPNDQSDHDGRTCDQDMKDGGGVHPPDTPSPGDQL
ncbi:hypothetical protein ACPCIX_02085 [Streptomyces pseudogriseolus]|uniref:hypothetical protein n=1 Tax=Streptomyces TaxID=1883 RepID=UPI00099DD1A3|nr:hypothetical protein [Streptomyces sp. NRRL S-1314]